MPANGLSLTTLYVAFKAAFRRAFDGAEDTDLYKRLATVVPSTAGEEIYQWLGQVPRMREWLGDRVIEQMLANEFRIKNKDFEATVEVLRNQIQDNQMAGLEFMFGDLGVAAAEWPNELVFGVLKDGDTLLGYDGVPLFSASHPVAGGTQSNIQSGAGDKWWLLDTRRNLKPIIFQDRQKPNLVRKDRPTDDNMFHNKRALYGVDTRGAAAPGLWHLGFQSEDTLDTTNFDAAMAAMMGRENEKQRPMGIRPNLLVVTPGNRAAAMELLKVDRLASGATNKNFQAVDLIVTSLAE